MRGEELLDKANLEVRFRAALRGELAKGDLQWCGDGSQQPYLLG